MIETKINDLEITKTDLNANKAIICLHGYGANYQDLAPLSQALADATKGYDWIFPNAPLKLDFSPFYDSRAWFHIDPNRLIPSLASGEVESLFPSGYPEGMLLATEKIKSLISVLEKDYDEIILGGFSQGSMVASQIVFEKGFSNISKLFILSGSLVSLDKWAQLLSTSDVKIFQSHGKEDPVLPFYLAQKLHKLINDKFSTENHFYEFDGGHEIPPHILNKLGDFLGE